VRAPTECQVAAAWSSTNSFSHRDFPEAFFRRSDRPSVAICLPARNESATIGPIVRSLVGLRERRIVDEVLVVDDSSDGSAAIAETAGATVHRQADLLPQLGPVLGKGDAMWRALSVINSEIVCYLDSDSEIFGAHFARGLLGPLIRDPKLALVKGFYRRPFKAAGMTLPEGGGRVTELMARPLLNRFYPELAAFRQPLAGEFAVRRDLLESLPFAPGYGVEIGLLLDAYRSVGIAGLAQVDLGVRQNRHQELRQLGPMAAAVLAAVTERLERDGRLLPGSAEAFLLMDGADAADDLGRWESAPLLSRPPFRSLPQNLSGLQPQAA
jgi:glucosyl-3-phosphoglycerate synthase